MPTILHFPTRRVLRFAALRQFDSPRGTTRVAAILFDLAGPPMGHAKLQDDAEQQGSENQPEEHGRVID